MSEPVKFVDFCKKSYVDLLAKSQKPCSNMSFRKYSHLAERLIEDLYKEDFYINFGQYVDAISHIPFLLEIPHAREYFIPALVHYSIEHLGSNILLYHVVKCNFVPSATGLEANENFAKYLKFYELGIPPSNYFLKHIFTNPLFTEHDYESLQIDIYDLIELNLENANKLIHFLNCKGPTLTEHHLCYAAAVGNLEILEYGLYLGLLPKKEMLDELVMRSNRAFEWLLNNEVINATTYARYNFEFDLLNYPVATHPLQPAPAPPLFLDEDYSVY